MFNFNRKDDDMFAEYYASKAENSTVTEEEPKGFSPEDCSEEKSEGEFGKYYPDEEPAKEDDVPMVPRRRYIAMVCIYTVLLILFSIGNYYNTRQIKRAEEDLRLATEEVEFSRATIKAYELRAERDEELIDSLQGELAVKELDSFLRNYDFSESDSDSPGPDSPKSQSYDGIDIVPNDDSGPGAYVDDFMKTQPSSDG